MYTRVPGATVYYIRVQLIQRIHIPSSGETCCAVIYITTAVFIYNILLHVYTHPSGYADRALRPLRVARWNLHGVCGTIANCASLQSAGSCRVEVGRNRMEEIC